MFKQKNIIVVKSGKLIHKHMPQLYKELDLGK